MIKRFIPAGLAGLLFLLPLAPAAQRSDVEITVRERRIDQPGLESATLVFVLDVRNASAAALSLARADYRVIIGSTEYIRNETDIDPAIPVPARETTQIAFPVKFTYSSVIQKVAEAQGRDRLDCNLVGGLTFRDERKRERRVPVAFSGDFPVFRGFDVRILPFEARDLTLGGADITFRAALINPNGFEIRPERVNYKVLVADKIIAEGTLTGTDSIPARGQVDFGLPLLLDFFEVGREVFQALDNPPASVRLQGQVEALWDWGTVLLPFDRTEKVAVQKTGRGQNQ